MNFLAELKARFSDTTKTEVDQESRRRFLKGSAGLAAVAAVGGPGVMQLLGESEQQRLVEQIKSTGIVENMYFYVDRPLVIQNIDGVIIRNCHFECLPEFVGDCILETKNASNFVINGCVFNSQNAFYELERGAIGLSA